MDTRRSAIAAWLTTSLSVWVGCHSRSLSIPIQTAVVPAIASSTTAPTASPQAHPNCDIVAAQNKEKFAEGVRTWNDATFDDGGTASYDEFLPNPCFLRPNSAWTAALETFSPVAYPFFEATWSLVHVDSSGALARLHDDGEIFTVGVGGAFHGPKRFWIFDFDDDGDPEIVFTYVQGGVETSDVETEYVYRYKSGAIESYVPVDGWTDLKDVDGDGRPDAIEAYDVEDPGGCGIYETERLVGPAFVAHSVHGGFSTTDAVSKRFAMIQCPARPSSIVVMQGKSIDEAATATNAVCARAWGATEASVVNEIETRCRPMTCASATTRSRLPGECFHRQTLISWAKQAPFVSLP